MTLKIDKIGMANNIKSSRLGSIFYRWIGCENNRQMKNCASNYIMLELTEALAGLYFFVDDDMLINIPPWRKSSTDNVP
jgi:hypothetical protein